MHGITDTRTDSQIKCTLYKFNLLPKQSGDAAVTGGFSRHVQLPLESPIPRK